MKQTAKPEQNMRRLRQSSIGLAAGLAIQFVVGMYLNFYVELPDSHPGVSGSYAPSIPWALAGHAGLALAIHVTLWILLTLGAVASLVRGIRSQHKALIAGTALGLLFILMAGSGGLTFLNGGGQDRDSFMMALSFLFALFAYCFTFYKTADPK